MFAAASRSEQVKKKKKKSKSGYLFSMMDIWIGCLVFVRFCVWGRGLVGMGIVLISGRRGLVWMDVY